MKKGTGWSDNETSERDKREYEAAVRKLGRSYLADKEMQQASIDQLEANESSDKKQLTTENGTSKSFKDVAIKMLG